MEPIEKNIFVVDEQGNHYEATYMKRAKGLVKNRRARFVNENTICLACSPDKTEEKTMSKGNHTEFLEEQTNIPASEITAHEAEQGDGADVSRVQEDCSVTDNKYNMNYVLEQIEKLAVQTTYLNNIISELRQMEAGKGESGTVPDLAGQAKAEALGNIVKCRETTIQQLLRFYEKMYDDLKPRDDTVKLNAISALAKLHDNVGAIEALGNALNRIVVPD